MVMSVLNLFAVTASAVPAISANNILVVETISDFAGNEFALIEGNETYEIYDSSGSFVEGSYATNSPFLGFDGEKYYLGPGNYFVLEDDSVFDIFAGESYPIENYEGLSFELEVSSETLKNKKEPSTDADEDKTYIDTSGFTVINEADYFRNLKYFPENWFGECGVVGLSMLLSYYDTFYNDDFIPNDATYDARYYVDREMTKASRSEEGSSDKVLNEKVEEPLTRTVTTTYKETLYYDFSDWSEMPGTTYAMRDYIFDKYIKTFWGLGWNNVGYPMFDGELKNTLEDYMEENCEYLLNYVEFKYGRLSNTHSKSKEYINEGLPVLLVLQDYDTTNFDGNNHVVLAYGYDDDKFLAHFGWYPGANAKSEIIISSGAAIYGYFAMEYSGSHKHSSNVSMTKGDETKYICGCGLVHDPYFSSYISSNSEGFNFDSVYVDLFEKDNQLSVKSDLSTLISNDTLDIKSSTITSLSDSNLNINKVLGTSLVNNLACVVYLDEAESWRTTLKL